LRLLDLLKVLNPEGFSENEQSLPDLRRSGRELFLSLWPLVLLAMLDALVGR
jgi:hypothetical protein